MKRLASILIAGTITAAAAPAAAQSGAADRRGPRRAEQRYQIGQMERVLEGAVEHGVTVTRDRLQELAQVPADLLVSDNAHARGFRLEGYGVFFDVIVPSSRNDVDVEPAHARSERPRARQRVAHAPDPHQDGGRSESGAGAQARRAAGQSGRARSPSRPRLSRARATVDRLGGVDRRRHAGARRRPDPDRPERGVSHRSHRRR